MKKRNALKKIAAYALLTGVTAVIASCSEQSLGSSSIDITGASYARDFALTDQFGQLRSLKDFAGKVVVIFFGYVQCPDVCPTSMTDLSEVKKLLGPNGARLQVLFITVDPQRDTPKVLKAYMQAFDPSFLALYSTPEKLVTLAKDFRIYYKKVAGTSTGSYSVDHTAGSYVYDTKGQLRLYSPYGSGAPRLAADIERLLKDATPA